MLEKVSVGFKVPKQARAMHIYIYIYINMHIILCIFSMGMVEKEKKHGDPFNFAPQVNMQKWVIISAMTL